MKLITALALLTMASMASAARYEFNPPGSVNGKGILQEVLSRSNRGNYFAQKYASDLATCCHECSHDVNGRATHELGAGVEALYVGQGMVVAFRQPRMTIGHIAQRVPAQYRDQCYFQLYFVQQPRDQIINNMPLYIFDEWTAACNGAQAAQELGKSDTGDLAMANQFCFFADAFLATVREVDPSYAELSDLEQFVRWQKHRVHGLNNGKRHPRGERVAAVEHLPWRPAKIQQTTAVAKPMQCESGTCSSYPESGWQGTSSNQVVTQPIQQPPEQPTYADPDTPSRTQEEIREAWNQYISSEIAIALKSNPSERGPAGPPGPPGPPGQTPNANQLSQQISQAVNVVVEQNFEQRFLDIESRLDAQENHVQYVPNYDVIAAEVRKRLPPFWIRAHKSEDWNEVELGDEIDLNLERESSLVR